ncbi:unnamed protein product [Phytomonas sp. EM1]|nr:unnamed protein product [Phytomonas sp. EM1]|eukprot:CCW63421.1 unnamed protein product [Phytomonas sp. isolate EM1]
MHSRDSNHQPSVAGSSKTLSVDKDKYELVYALVSSMGVSQHSRLSSIYQLLSSVVQSARTVVKGTDSQRRFSACFSELCRGALMGLSDLEDSVFELRNPGKNASDATDDEVMGISEVALVKELSAYVASHTSALTAQYLERVGLSVLNKHSNPGSRKGGASSSWGMSDNNDNRKKRVRSTGEIALEANRKRSKQSNQGISLHDKVAVGGSGPISGHHAMHAAFDDLGLLKEDETMIRSTMATTTSNTNATSGLTFHMKTADGTSGLLHSSTIASHMPISAPSKQSLFLSSDGTKAFDSSISQPNLRAIPEFDYYLRPWTMPAPKGVLDRVTLEKERHTSSMTSLPVAGIAADDSHVDSKLQHGLIPTLEVCFAATPGELLSRLERRDAALSSMAFCMPWVNSDDQQGSGRRRNQVPFSAMEPRSSTDLASRVEVNDEMEKEGETARRSGKEECMKGEGFIEKPFFPSPMCASSAVPLTVLKDLVFNGISNIDFIHYS